MNSTITATNQPGTREWPYRTAFVVWILLGLTGAWFSTDMGAPATITLGIVWLGGLGIFLRDFIASLLGPVLAYDLMRMGRRKRTFWVRSLYAATMGLIFTWLFMTWAFSHEFESRNDPKALSQLATTFFGVYMCCQFALICLITPATVASTITDEKERRTMEFMLATDLRDREIIFGKLATRVGNILLLMLAGLPVLTMVQFFGGIEPDQVIAGFAASFVTVLSIAGVSIAASVISRKSRDAIALSNLLIVAYCCISGLGMGFAAYIQASNSASAYGLDFVNWEDVVYPFVTGNPFYMVPSLLIGRGFGSSARLLNGTLHYMAFHLVILALTTTWSGFRLRSIALAQTFGGSEKSSRKSLFRQNSKHVNKDHPSTRPDIGDSPILWKEIFVDSGLRMGWFAKSIIALLVFCSLIPLVIILYDASITYYVGANRQIQPQVFDDLADRVNSYVRVLSPLIGTILFLATSVRGAGTIIGERDRHSLDVLLTTPLSTGRILWGKWWGCLLGMRLGWCWLFSVWLIGLACGALSPLMLPALILSTAVYAGGFAWIGIYCSITLTSSLRSTLTAIIMSIMFGGGYLIFFVCGCILPLELSSIRPGNSIDLLLDFMLGFSPPVNLGWLPIHDFSGGSTRMVSRDIPYLPFWILGLFIWGLLNWFFSRISLARFRTMANRSR